MITKVKTNHTVFPPLFLPDIPLNLIIISRSVATTDAYIYQQKQQGQISKAIIKKLFYPEQLEAWRDRAKDCHVIAIESPSDPIYYREQIGRMKLFFPFMDILRSLS